jgi:hypothetical protein
MFHADELRRFGRDGACREIAGQPRSGPPSHADRRKFARQQPAQPYTVD